MDGALFYKVSEESTGLALWTSDGTVAGTRMVAALDMPQEPGDLLSAGDSVYFSAGDGVRGRELWTFDVATASIRPVVDVAQDGSGRGFQVFELGGALYFSATGGGAFRELWTSDGTAAVASVAVKRVRPGCGEATGPSRERSWSPTWARAMTSSTT